MGHSDDLVFQHYQSRIVPVDTHAIAQGQEQRMDQINFTRSMSFGRNLNAPKPRTASLIKSGKRSRIACNSKEEYERERAVKGMRLIEGLPAGRKRVVRHWRIPSSGL